MEENKGNFSDDDSLDSLGMDDPAFQLYSAQRRREMLLAHIAPAEAVQAVGEPPVWAARSCVLSSGKKPLAKTILRDLRFWSKPDHEETPYQHANQTGVSVWPSCIALSGVLEARHAESRHCFNGARALELGAGVGVAGIVLARLGAAHVVLTDAQDSVMSLLKLNCRDNAVGSSTRVARLHWEDADDGTAGLSGHNYIGP